MVFRRLGVIMIFLICFCQGGASWAEEELSGILEEIQAKYRDLTGLTISYTREVVTRSMSMMGNRVKADLAEGKIYFKPPYFLRLEQTTPKAEEIITNGDTLWWYVPHQKRVYQYPYDKFGQELRILSDIFRGLKRADENFKMNLVRGDEREFYLIELHPEPPWEQIDHIVLTISKEYDIRGVEIHNRLGSITRFTLLDWSVKDAFREGFFDFAAPEGIEVVKEQ